MKKLILASLIAVSAVAAVGSAETEHTVEEVANADGTPTVEETREKEETPGEIANTELGATKDVEGLESLISAFDGDGVSAIIVGDKIIFRIPKSLLEDIDGDYVYITLTNMGNDEDDSDLVLEVDADEKTAEA